MLSMLTCKVELALLARLSMARFCFVFGPPCFLAMLGMLLLMCLLSVPGLLSRMALMMLLCWHGCSCVLPLIRATSLESHLAMWCCLPTGPSHTAGVTYLAPLRFNRPGSRCCSADVAAAASAPLEPVHSGVLRLNAAIWVLPTIAAAAAVDLVRSPLS